MRKSLYPSPEPVTINPKAFLFWIFVFALAFFVIGIWTVHYPAITGLHGVV